MRWNVDTKAPEPPKAARVKQNIRGMKELVIEDLTLVTPMLGGGVTALKTDKDLVVRGQAIRGQLRFWWRTFQACTEVADLWKKEAELWGSTKQASRVEVRGEMIRMPDILKYVANTKNNPVPKYVAFPLDNDTTRKHFDLFFKGAFRLIISYPASNEDEVLGSVKLWMLFGGLGARTRRGLGAVYSPRWPTWQNKEQVLKFLNTFVPKPDNASRPWPSLINSKLILCPATGASPLQSWQKWIDTYQRFRQYRVDKKNPQKKSPYGKSTWPEPDTLRGLNKNNNMPANAFFPRGAYGLPIIFHFPPKHGDMSFTLQGGDSDRFASPLIIKTIKINDHSLLDACLLLNSRIPKKIIISDERKQDIVVPQTAMPLANNPQAHRKPLEGRDPYTALLEWMGDGRKPVNLGGA